MVLAFNEEGKLPAGEYELSLVEFKEMFVHNMQREWIYQGFLKLVEDLRAINCKVVYADGSFVTNKEEPNDIDVCWRDDNEIDWDKVGSEYQILLDLDPPRDWQRYRYHADVFPANVYEGDSGKQFKDFFQVSKETGKPKGIIKIRIDYDKE